MIRPIILEWMFNLVDTCEDYCSRIEGICDARKRCVWLRYLLFRISLYNLHLIHNSTGQQGIRVGLVALNRFVTST